MVVDDVQNPNFGAVGQLPMGDIGLPTFIWLLSAKRAPRRPGPFCGCGLTKPRRDKIRQIVNSGRHHKPATIAHALARQVDGNRFSARV
jgi:hypothetical protein